MRCVRAIDAGADGIGLYRSEFLYMLHPDDYPDEQTQFEAYRAAADCAANGA